MELARVEGKIVSTAKQDKLRGYKLLLLNLVGPDAKPTENYIVAVDTVGAGPGEIVIAVRGSSARQAEGLADVPSDTSIVAIVDSVERNGETLYNKNLPESE